MLKNNGYLYDYIHQEITPVHLPSKPKTRHNGGRWMVNTSTGGTAESTDTHWLHRYNRVDRHAQAHNRVWQVGWRCEGSGGCVVAPTGDSEVGWRREGSGGYVIAPAGGSGARRAGGRVEMSERIEINARWNYECLE